MGLIFSLFQKRTPSKTKMKCTIRISNYQNTLKVSDTLFFPLNKSRTYLNNVTVCLFLDSNPMFWWNISLAKCKRNCCSCWHANQFCGNTNIKTVRTESFTHTHTCSNSTGARKAHASETMGHQSSRV